MRVDLAYAGEGKYVAEVLDKDGATVEAIWGRKSEVLAEIADRWAGLPLRQVPFIREQEGNPARRCGKETAAPATVTDRALRYRANAYPPPGARICAFCGSTRNVEVGHVDGHEENGHPSNLIWTCRSCNTKTGAVFKRLGLGRRTVQFNPAAQGARSLGQWLAAVLSMKGESDAMPVAAAVEMIRATPPARRSEFAHEIWRRRRARFGPSGRSGSVPF